MQPDMRKIEARYEAEMAHMDRAEQEAPKLGEILFSIAKDIEKPEPWTPTGLDPLDRLLDGGIRKGEVFVLAARPSVGKSALALQIILNVCDAGIPVALWSLEMRPKQWMRRALASMSGIHPSALRTGSVPESHLPYFVSASERLHKLPLHFAVGETDPATWEMEAMRQVMHNEVRLLVIDYLQLMDPPQAAYSRENEVAQTSKAIKRFANKAGVSVLLLAQLNRDAEGKVPTKRDLRESGSIEQDADEILFLHRDTEPETNTLLPTGLGILAKNRDGESGAFGLEFMPKEFRFYPRERKTEQQDWRSRRTS